jgi:hypothetical protein
MTGNFFRFIWREIKRRLGPETKLNTLVNYETYRRVQEEGNLRKLNLVYARQGDIEHVARYAERRIGVVRSVLCHGTRNGAELRWFKAALRGQPRVLGTEISSTAASFADTIQWDFHEILPEWENSWDLIYSNSWDHAFDPIRAFHNWMRCLTPNGLLFLEHSKNHEPAAANLLDPFGATLNGLIKTVNSIAPDQWRVLDVVSDLPESSKRRIVVVGRT